MKVFLLFLAAGFALWGVGDVTTGLIGGSDKAISAGDESQSPAEVAIQFDRTRRSFMPNASLGEALQTGLLNEVAGALARDVVFRAEASDLGLTVTREMQRRVVASEQAFQDEFGEFSEGRFMQVLGNAGFTEEDYLKQVDSTLRREQLLFAISAGIGQPESMARTLTAYELERRSAKLISIAVDPSNIADPDESVLGEWYESVSASYDAPALRSARVGSLSPDMFAAEMQISDADIAAAYDARLDEFTTPETREIRQMVFDDAAAAQTAFDRVEAGEAFADVAADMLGWTADDVALGTVSKADLDGPLGEAAFGLALNEVVGPVESVFGQHLLTVSKINEGGNQSLEDVSNAIRTTLRAEAAVDLIYDKVNELEDVIASGATLDEAMAAVGGRVDRLVDVDRNGLTIDGTAVEGDAVDLAQDSLVLELVWTGDIDELSVIQEGADDMFFVVEATGVTAPRARPLDEVRSRVITDWKRGEAIKAARAEATVLTSTPEKFDDVVPTDDFNRNGIGLDHEAARLIARRVFATDVGEVGVIETGNEAIASMTVTIVPVEGETLDTTAELIGGAITNSMQQDILNVLARDLSQTHDLQINLGRVQQLLAGQQ
jgi:peptidyl-prolyl cis-trans isomerase D